MELNSQVLPRWWTARFFAYAMPSIGRVWVLHSESWGSGGSQWAPSYWDDGLGGKMPLIAIFDHTYPDDKALRVAYTRWLRGASRSPLPVPRDARRFEGRHL